MLSRTKYDNCTVGKWASENSGITQRLMDPVKYNHPNPKFFEFGLLGGNTVSVQATNMVDLESELSGRSYYASKCPQMKWMDGQSIECPSNNPDSFPIGIDAKSGRGCAIGLNLNDKKTDTFTKQQRYTSVYVPDYTYSDANFDPQPFAPSYLGKYDGNFN
jgi:hypothetical protein